MVTVTTAPLPEYFTVPVLGVNTPAVAPIVKGVPVPDNVVVPEPALNSVLFAIARTLLAPVMVIVGLLAEASMMTPVFAPLPNVKFPLTVSVRPLADPNVCVAEFAPGKICKFL